jgi:hypothetical protein
LTVHYPDKRPQFCRFARAMKRQSGSAPRELREECNSSRRP